MLYNIISYRRPSLKQPYGQFRDFCPQGRQPAAILLPLGYSMLIRPCKNVAVDVGRIALENRGIHILEVNSMIR
jgi:hypothetical protein